LWLKRAICEPLGAQRALALADELAPRRQPPANGHDDAGLTAREREVAALVAEGKTNRQIAEQPVMSESTADVHVKCILRKLNVRSRASMAVWAVDHGCDSTQAIRKAGLPAKRRCSRRVQETGRLVSTRHSLVRARGHAWAAWLCLGRLPRA
jgi:DNA-binding CsgD family transcriptional regulator